MEACHRSCCGLGISRASVLVRAWSKQTREQIDRSHDQYAGALCCCLRGTLSLHLLAEDVSLVPAGAGTALSCSEQHQGCPLSWQRCACTRAVTPLDWHFLKEPSYPRVTVYSPNTLQPHVHAFDSDASPPMSVELLQLYRSATESPTKLTVFKAKRLG